MDDLQRRELLTLQAVSYSHDQPASKYGIALSSSKSYITNELLMSEPQFSCCIRIRLVPFPYIWKQEKQTNTPFIAGLFLVFLLVLWSDLGKP